MKYLAAYSLVRGDISIPIRSIVLVVMILTTQTCVMQSAPVKNQPTKSTEFRTKTMIKTETDKTTQAPIFDSSKIFNSQHENESLLNYFQQNYGHEVNQEETFLYPVEHLDTFAPTKISSIAVLNVTINKHTLKQINNNFSSSTTQSLTTYIDETYLNTNEQLDIRNLKYPRTVAILSTQATLIQNPKRKDMKGNTDNANMSLDKKDDHKLLFDSKTHTRESSGKSSIFQKSPMSELSSTVALVTTRATLIKIPTLQVQLMHKVNTEDFLKSLGEENEHKSSINTNTYDKDNNTESAIITSMPKIKNVSDVGIKHLDNFTTPTKINEGKRYEQEEHSNINIQFKDIKIKFEESKSLGEENDHKSSINMITYDKPNNTESVIIASISKFKNISAVDNKHRNKSTEHNEEKRDEQKEQSSININMIFEQKDNLSRDDKKQTMKKTFNAKDKNKVNRSEENSIYRKNWWQPQNRVTLKPTQNGFLGPIHMEEKIFSSFNKEKLNRHHYSHSRDDKFVEIIDPKGQHEKTTVIGSKLETFSATLNDQQEESNSSLLSTTVFQVSDSHTSTTHIPSSTQFQSISYAKQSVDTTPQLFETNQQTESKISDIQIEVYDSTVDSIISSTNFKESESLLSSSIQTAIFATKPPISSPDQDKFTQYVIDHEESSTEKSNLAKSSFAVGAPEPAAIEIHINVSEGRGNESEDLEFSYHQKESSDKCANMVLDVNSSLINKINTDVPLKSNYTGSSGNEQSSDEILVVEIVDSGDNSTENSSSFENINVNPIITFSSDTVKHVAPKNSYHKSETRQLNKEHKSDDLFMPDERDIGGVKSRPQMTSVIPSTWNHKLVSDRDSDTIFYISNTEVKVGESLPAFNSNTEQQLKKSRLESQFFPANYMSSTHPNIKLNEHRPYEEDILLSPIHNSANLVKIVRSEGDISPPLDVTYVGESVMEVEQSSGAGIMPPSSSTTSFSSSSSSSALRSQRPDVIIEPATLPEISIGVPIIGELPPQIELKEIDYMPSEDGENNSHDNDVERIVESSIQYGGDLIDEGGVIGGGGFDGIEGSYPFGNPVLTKSRFKTNADFLDISVNSHMSNLRKDDLIADVSSSVEMSLSNFLDNGTIRDMLKRNESDLDDMLPENYTTFYHPSSVEDSVSCLSNLKTLFFAWFFTLLPLLVIVCAAFAIGYLYRRHRVDGKNNEEMFNDEWPSQTDHLPTLTLNDVIVEINSKCRSNPQDKQIILPNRNPASNECCTLGNYAAPSENDCNSKASPNQSSSVHSSYLGPNGSVTTMTLKNNHLIVETEERNDISRDTRETKMHYSNADKDGIFVVEVARGIDSKSMPDSPVSRTNQSLMILEPTQNCSTIDSADDASNPQINLPQNHEEVQIHQPPHENPNSLASEDLQMVLHQIVEVEEPVHSPNSRVKQADMPDYKYGRTSSTGLSQSDLSSTSSTDSNKRYSYGNQELYTAEKLMFCPLLPTIQSPLQTAERDTDDDHQSENGQGLFQSPTKLESIANGHNGTQRHETSTNLTNQLNETSSEEKCQGAFRAEKFVNHSTDGKRPGTIANGNAIVENYFENSENCNGYDSLMSLPDPPSIEEIKQLNVCNFIESNQLDSLPPPPPPIQLITDSNALDNLEENQVQHKELTTEASTELYKNNSISSAPLTPPASPPHYTIPNLIKVAVNVNSS